MRAFLLTICALSMTIAAAAQPQPEQRAPRAPQPATPAVAPVALPPPVARREGQPINIKVELTIVDQRGSAQALRKTVTVVAGDNMTGFIRSSANYSNIGNVPLNVDVEPALLSDGKIRLRLNLEYDLPAAAAVGPQENIAASERTLRVTQIKDNLALILESGKSMIAAQSADPVGDRQVTIEVKATTMK